MEALHLSNVSKTYGASAPAVQDLTFALEAGQFGVLVGPSGAGKTTVLNMIAGIIQPDVGELVIGNKSTAGIAPEDRDVAMVFENYALYPHKTVRKNLEFPLRAPRRRKDLSKDEIHQRVTEVAKTLGIDRLLDRLPSQLSGGQRQRVSLGRALVRRPRILLLDEPITHLDAKLRHEMRTELKRIQRDLGITTLYATPDQGDALALADVAVVLHEGRSWQIGTAYSIYHQPEHVRVAEIIGDPRMNILSGQLNKGHVHVLGTAVSAERHPLGGHHSGPVLVGFRPNEVQLENHEEPGAVRGTVTLTQPLGYADVLYVDVAGTLVRVVSKPRLHAGGPGTVWLRLPDESLHFFDPDTGSAISERRAA
jgi:ABC-type sugar transport system ATPase subunit